MAEQTNKDITGILEVKFEPGDIVLDIGAHIGLFCVPLAKRNPHIHIYAYEPMPHSFENLCENIRNNSVHNITPINRAIGRSAGPITIYQHPTNSGSATASKSHVAFPSFEVGCISLEDAVRCAGKVKALK